MKLVEERTYGYNYRFEEKYWWYAARRNIMLDWIHQFIQVDNPLILDYGCGTGKFTESLLSLGYRVEPADTSKKAIEFCRKRGLQNVINLNESELQSDRYDLIVMGDVIEHIEDDMGILKSLKHKLKPNGNILITVPAYNWLWSGEDHISHHIRRYTLGVVKRIVLTSGMKIKKASYFNTFLFPIIVLIILTKKILFPKTQKKTDLQEIWPPVNKLLKAIFESEKHWLRFLCFPFGASIIVLAKKENKSVL